MLLSMLTDALFWWPNRCGDEKAGVAAFPRGISDVCLTWVLVVFWVAALLRGEDGCSGASLVGGSDGLLVIAFVVEGYGWNGELIGFIQSSSALGVDRGGVFSLCLELDASGLASGCVAGSSGYDTGADDKFATEGIDFVGREGCIFPSMLIFSCSR